MIMNSIDKPVDIREGEELDIPLLEKYLQEKLGDIKGNLKVKQFPSGFSNLTYLLTTKDREMILRRPPFGKKAKTAHDMKREFDILTALKGHYPCSPEALLYSEGDGVMETPFYVMERIKGIILRKDLPEGMSLDDAGARQLSENLVKALVELHGIDYKKIGLVDFGKPEGYVQRQVEGWSRRYRNARTPDAPDFEAVMKWLVEKMPPDTDKPALIHNDYKLDNAVLDPGNPVSIIGILDWEMATIGDPFMDLGNGLAYWINNDDPDNMQLIRQMPTNLPGMLSRREQVDLYCELSGRSIDSFDYYYCFGLFRLAVIAQQIYYRFYHGQTKDPRFKMLIFAVKILEDVARKVIDHSGL